MREWLLGAWGPVPDAVREVLSSGGTHEDVTAAFAQLLTDGIEPPRTALVMGAASLTRPGQATAFRRNPEGYVSEVSRISSPFHFAPRTAGPDTRIGDSPIPAGARVSVALCAANHDPAMFPNPETIDPTRPLRGHVAFGYGRPFCARSRLAEENLAAGLWALLGAGLRESSIVEPKYGQTPGMTPDHHLTGTHALC